MGFTTRRFGSGLAALTGWANGLVLPAGAGVRASDPAVEVVRNERDALGEVSSGGVSPAKQSGARWARAVEYGGLAVAAGLAAALRLGWPGVNSFAYDEARVSLLALQMARRGTLVSVGIPSSTGVPNLPAAVWLMAIPFGLSSDPLVATLAVGAAGVLAVAGVWWLAREAWGPWAAFVAATLLAASPFASLYSRAIWGQDLLIPLAVLWAVAAVVGISRGRGWALALHVFVAGFAFQVHYAGAALALGTAWLVVRFRLWRRWRPVVAGAGLAAAAAAPFVVALARAPAVLTSFRRLLQLPAQADLSALRWLAEMGAGAHWEWLILGEGWRWPAWLGRAMGAASLASGALIAAGLAILFWRLVRGLRQEARDAAGVLGALVPVWALAAPLLFVRHSTPAYPQYQLPALPALFLSAGAVAGRLRRRGCRAAVAALAATVALVQAVPVAQGLGTVAVRLTPGGVGTPLVWPRAAVAGLMDGRAIAVHSFGDDPATGGDAAGFSVLLWGYPHRIVDGRSALLIPGGGPAHLFFTFADLPAWSEAQALGLGGSERSLPRREGEPPYMALTVERASLAGLRPVGPFTLANGARLEAWQVRAVGPRLRLTTLWKIVGPLMPGEYHQFNHLRMALDGEPLQVSDVPVSSQAWQVGDTLISWADFDRPAAEGPFWLDVGMYTWPEVRRTPVVGRAGDPLAPIGLGPFAWPE